MNSNQISEMLRISDVDNSRGIELDDEDLEELMSDTENDVVDGKFHFKRDINRNFNNYLNKFCF